MLDLAYFESQDVFKNFIAKNIEMPKKRLWFILMKTK